METNWGDTPSVTLNLPRHNNIKFMNDTKKNLPSLKIYEEFKGVKLPCIQFCYKGSHSVTKYDIGVC